MQMKPIVAVVGRPNVGKSTFFNRVTGTRDALVNDMPGVTRDRHYGDALWNDVPFTLVDTGGFSDTDAHGFADQIRLQVHQAIADADAVVLLMDGKTGVSPFDREMILLLRKAEKPVFYAVNKIDGAEQEPRLYDFYSLGIQRLYPVSAEHRYGMTDLLDDLTGSFPEAARVPEAEAVGVAVVGRPNVGKSSLINRMLGQDRLLVSETPGTTRDSIDSICRFNGKTYRLIDTAGIRRKGKVTGAIEKFSVIKSLRSLERCDVALIVVDAVEGVTDQDISVAGYAFERGCGCIFLINKWDAVEKDGKTAKTYTGSLREASKFLSFAPILTLSALTGLRTRRIFPLVDDVFDQYAGRLGTGQTNRILERAVETNEPPMHRGKRLKFYYGTQVGTKPPTFVIFVNAPEAVHFSYRRYLTNQIRQQTGLNHTPLRLVFKQRSGRKTFVAAKGRQKKAGAPPDRRRKSR